MRKTIWTCWLPGLEKAPDLVRRCVESWRFRNPGWDVRCLDASTIARYIDLASYPELSRQGTVAGSPSEVWSLLLLHEFGGVWVDPTLLCNAALDDWLEPAMPKGFFAFARQDQDRELASWFLASRPGNRLIAAWAARAIKRCQDRATTQNFFWIESKFNELIGSDRDAASDWRATPRITTDGPYSAQIAGVLNDLEHVTDRVDWSAPVFKLANRTDQVAVHDKSLLHRLLDVQDGDAPEISLPLPHGPAASSLPITHLRVSTGNLGDHIQIIAAQRLLARAGLSPSQWVDRDDEIANPPLQGCSGILVNGWFKTNPAQWPPHPDLVPIYLGFHIRLFQAPSLIGPEAIAHYRTHGPIGCRDRYTLNLLRGQGVEAFLSHCLTLSYPRRLPDAQTQCEVFVVSADERLCAYVPDTLGPYTYINHYSGEDDFVANMDRARALLESYRGRARLIVTTFLHCALPAIAMGIPVVVFNPANEGAAKVSDRQRFSSLADIVRVYDLAEAGAVDWEGACPDVSRIKLALLDNFFAMARRWSAAAPLHVA